MQRTPYLIARASAFGGYAHSSLCLICRRLSLPQIAPTNAGQRKVGWMPVVYTRLSLSIYCTAWTFYGAVGYAARSGLEYLTIYVGPSLVMIGWWWLLRRMVRIGRSQRITSIADMISSRYGKSNVVAAGVTILAVIGTTPYIALQLNRLR